jgi:hypothetical protein
MAGNIGQSSTGTDTNQAQSDELKQKREEAAKKAQEEAGASTDADATNDGSTEAGDLNKAKPEEKAETKLDIKRPGSNNEEAETPKKQEKTTQESKTEAGNLRTNKPGEIQSKTLEDLQTTLTRKIETLNQKTEAVSTNQDTNIAERAPQLTKVNQKESKVKQKDEHTRLQALKLIQQKSEALIKQGKESEAKALLENLEKQPAEALDELVKAEGNIQKLRETTQKEQEVLTKAKEELKSKYNTLDSYIKMANEQSRLANNPNKNELYWRDNQKTRKSNAENFDKQRAEQVQKNSHFVKTNLKEKVEKVLSSEQRLKETDSLLEQGDTYGASQVAQGNEYTKEKSISLAELDIGEIPSQEKHKGLPKDQKTALDYKEQLDSDISSRQKKLTQLRQANESQISHLDRNIQPKEREQVQEYIATTRKKISEQTRELEARQQVQERFKSLLDQKNFTQISQLTSGKNKLTVEQKYNRDPKDTSTLTKEAKITVPEAKANQTQALSELGEQNKKIEASKTDEAKARREVHDASVDVARAQAKRHSGGHAGVNKKRRDIRNKQEIVRDKNKELNQQKDTTHKEVAKAKKQQTNYSVQERRIADSEELREKGKAEEATKVLEGERLTTKEKVEVTSKNEDPSDKYAKLEKEERDARIFTDRVESKIKDFETGIKQLKADLETVNNPKTNKDASGKPKIDPQNKDKIQAQLELVGKMHGSLIKYKNTLDKLIKNEQFDAVAKIKKVEDAHKYRVDLKESISGYKESIVSARQVIQKRNKESENSDLTSTERVQIAKGLAQNQKTIAEATRGLEKALKLHDTITDLIDEKNFEQIEQIRTGKTKLEVDQSYGKEYRADELLKTRPKLTITETEQDIGLMYGVLNDVVNKLDTASVAHATDAKGAAKDFQDLNPIIGGMLALADLIDGKSHIIANVQKHVELSNRSYARAENLKDYKAQAQTLIKEGKLREAHALLRQTITFGSKEEADLRRDAGKHYNEMDGVLEKNLDAFLETGRKVGIMAVAATVTIATAGTASGITVPIMAGTGAGIAFGFTAEVLISQTDNKKSLGDGFSSAFEKLPGDAQLALETSISSVIGVRTAGGLNSLAKESGKVAYKSAFKNALSQGLGRLSPHAQKVFMAGSAGAAGVTPGVTKDIIQSSQTRVDISTKLRQEAIDGGWSDQKLKTKLEQAFTDAKVDTKTILHRNALSFATGTVGGMIGGSGSHITDGKSALFKVGIEIGEELLNTSIATLEVMAQGIEPGSEEFANAVITNIAQASLSKAAAKAGLDGSANQKADIDANTIDYSRPDIDVHATKQVQAELKVKAEALALKQQADAEQTDTDGSDPADTDFDINDETENSSAIDDLNDTSTELETSSSSTAEKKSTPPYEALDNKITAISKKGEVTPQEISQLRKQVEEMSGFKSGQRARLASLLDGLDTSKLSISEKAELGYLTGKINGNPEQRLQHEVDLEISNKYSEGGNDPQVVKDHVKNLEPKIQQQMAEVQKLQQEGVDNKVLAEALGKLERLGLEMSAIRGSETVGHVAQKVDIDPQVKDLDTHGASLAQNGLKSSDPKTKQKAQDYIHDLALSQEQKLTRDNLISDLDNLVRQNETNPDPKSIQEKINSLDLETLNQTQLDQIQSSLDHARKEGIDLSSVDNINDISTAVYLKQQYGVEMNSKTNYQGQLKELGIEKIKLDIDNFEGDGIQIKYRDSDGNIPSTSNTLRLTDETMARLADLSPEEKARIPKEFFNKQGKVERFISNGELAGSIYHPKGSETDSINSSDKPIYITESAIKSMRLAQIVGDEAHVLGLNGIDSSRRNGELSPGLANLDLQGRKVILAPDSDYGTGKEGVVKSTEELAAELKARGAEVEILKVPDNGTDKGQGIDDYTHGMDQSQSKDALNKLERKKFESESSSKKYTKEQLAELQEASLEYLKALDDLKKPGADGAALGKKAGELRKKLQEGNYVIETESIRSLERLKSEIETDLSNITQKELENKIKGLEKLKFEKHDNENKELRSQLTEKAVKQLLELDYDNGIKVIEQITNESTFGDKASKSMLERAVSEARLSSLERKADNKEPLTDTEKLAFELSIKYKEEIKRKTGVDISKSEQGKLIQDIESLKSEVNQIIKSADGRDLSDGDKQTISNLEERFKNVMNLLPGLAGLKGIDTTLQKLIKNTTDYKTKFLDPDQRNNPRFNGDLFEMEATQQGLKEKLGHHVEEMGAEIDSNEHGLIDVDAITRGKIEGNDGQIIEGRFHAEQKDSLQSSLSINPKGAHKKISGIEADIKSLEKKIESATGDKVEQELQQELGNLKNKLLDHKILAKDFIQDSKATARKEILKLQEKHKQAVEDGAKNSELEKIKNKHESAKKAFNHFRKLEKEINNFAKENNLAQRERQAQKDYLVKKYQKMVDVAKENGSTAILMMNTFTEQGQTPNFVREGQNSINDIKNLEMINEVLAEVPGIHILNEHGENINNSRRR